METSDYLYLLPLIILAGAPVLLLLVMSIHRNYRLVFGLTILSVLLFMGAVSYTWSATAIPHQVGELLVVDSFTMFYLMLLGGAGLVILMVSYSYFSQSPGIREEYYVLFLTSLFGAGVLVASTHFASLFLGLEILSVSLYAIIAYTRTRLRSIEGGLKYLILAAASSAFLLFGMALIYTDTGALSFSEVGASFQTMGQMSAAGLAMMLVGVGFKLALVPFHNWTPDIYEGAPAPVSALIASVSKGSMVAVLLRFIYATSGLNINWLVVTLSLMAMASMMVGSILALKQNNLKRLLAYSSIAHLGYILIAVLTRTELSLAAVTFYLVAYFISIIGAFGTLAVFSSAEQEVEHLEDLQGMFWTRPWLSIIFSTMFFSLVGIPLTAGFIGKFYVVWAAVSDGLWLLAMVLVVSSVIGLYYYLRVIKTMLTPVDKDTSISSSALPGMGLMVLSVLGLLILFLGIYPSDLIEIIKSISFNP